MDGKKLLIVLIGLAVIAIACLAIAGSGSQEGQEPVPCAGITLDKTTLSVEEGGSAKVSATTTPEGCTDSVVWSSSDASVCTVSGGSVKGVSPGSAKVTAQCGSYAASCIVEVTKAPTVGEKNALAKAQSYLRSSAFSEKKLYDQLIYEKFDDAEARYGVEHCGADWYEQAEKKAQSYLSHMSFSKEKLYDQLLYEGFTQDQARKAVDKVYA